MWLTIWKQGTTVVTSLGIDILFYLFAFVAVLMAVLAVATPHILRAVVSLMALLVVTAGLYIMLGAEFLAAIQILVYVGGIVVLLVFAVMLTHTLELLEVPATGLRRAFAMAGCSLFFILSVVAIFYTSFPQVTSDPLTADAAQIGRKFLDLGAKGYLLPFEVISLLLLSAVIGGVVIARRDVATKLQVEEEE